MQTYYFYTLTLYLSYLKSTSTKNEKKYVIELLEQIVLLAEKDFAQLNTIIPLEIPKLIKVAASLDACAPDANFLLGFIYYLGCGLDRDKKLGLKYLNIAASTIAIANFYLGFHYLGGSKLEFETLVINSEKKELAFKYSENAFNQGFSPAKVCLAICYLKGVGIAQDQKKGIELLEQAAVQNDALGQYVLAFLYGNGTGVEKNHHRQIELLQLAASSEFELASTALGNIYASESSKNLNLAFLNFSGCYNSDAVFNLGYLHSQSENKDQFYIAYLLTLASMLENGQKAKHNLALSYHYNFKPTNLQRADLLYQAAAVLNIPEVDQYLNEPNRKNNHDLPHLDKCLKYYENLVSIKQKTPEYASALSTLAFCHQIGLGTHADVAKAITLYITALQHKNVQSLWDLHACYMHQYMYDGNTVVLSSFYKGLRQFIRKAEQPLQWSKFNINYFAALKLEATLLMATFKEYGSYFLDQNLLEAAILFEAANLLEAAHVDNSVQLQETFHKKYITRKINYFLPLKALREKTVQSLEFIPIPKGVASIIADYAFEGKGVEGKSISEMEKQISELDEQLASLNAELNALNDENGNPRHPPETHRHCIVQ